MEPHRGETIGRKRPGTWRYNLVFGLLMLAVPALCVRVALMVPDRWAQAGELAARQQRLYRPLPARPGGIFARTRRGYVPLAVSAQAPSCFADPLLMKDEEVPTVAARVAEALGMAPPEVRDRLSSRPKARFVWLKRQIGQHDVQQVRALGLASVGIQHEWRREYPSGELAATVVGFRLRDGRGGGGLELQLQRLLGAADGMQVSVADAGRRAIQPIPELSRRPRDGWNVFLCLDAVIQGYLQRAVTQSVEDFGARWGTGVVVCPRTGRVLAMCSVPSFNPNAFSTAPAADRTDRATCVPYEPGSALKPVFAAAAVQVGALSWQSRIDCGDGVYHARRGGRISDHGHSFGPRSLTDVIVVSSNIGMAKVGELLGNKRLYQTAQHFGFGRETGIELPGESAGIVRPLPAWNGYSLRRVPFGQEICVTAIQLAMAFCSLVNGGLLMRPTLLDHVTDPGGRVVWQGEPVVVRRVLSRQVAAQTLTVLGEVVDRGTGKDCRLSRWTSFGKTGTAQVAGPGGYNDRDYTATFIGGAPAGEPKILCLISIHLPDRTKGYYGAKVAAPYVREVLERTLRYLEVPPDLPGQHRDGRAAILAAAP